MISFSKFSDVLRAFTCARAIGNLWSIWLGGNILSCLWSVTLRSDTLATRSKILVIPFPYFLFGNIWVSKASRTICLPLKSMIGFLRVSIFFLFWLILLVLYILKKYQYHVLILFIVQVHDIMINHCYNFLFVKVWLF